MTTPLEKLSDSLCFEVDDIQGGTTPTPQLDQVQRTRIRSLTKMQKEALVTSSSSGKTWRLASDEGPYLNGADIAPPPLAFMLTGMISSFASQTFTLAEDRGIELNDATFVLDTRYSMEGSALAGTMSADAYPPELEVTIDSSVDKETLQDLIDDAVSRSPVYRMTKESLTSTFNLVFNGQEVEVDGVRAIDEAPPDDPVNDFESPSRAPTSLEEPLIRHTGRMTEPYDDANDRYLESDDSTISDEHDRIVHLQATCTLREDGVKQIEQRMYSPRGSIFKFLSDEPEGHGGQDRAPDAMTYAVAGIGFCFMTQLGRYAEVVGEELDSYRVVQDTHNSSGGTDAPSEASPVQTTLFVESNADETFACDLLDMSEQTCYLHALCRTPDLDPVIELSTR